MISIHNVKLYIKMMAIAMLCVSSFVIQAAEVMKTSVFSLPTSDYTHIVIETNQAVANSMLILKNPNRVVLDLTNTPINNQLKTLSRKSFADDLSIKQVRVGNFKAGVTRIVFDLKSEVKAVLTVAKPREKYQHRLMLDLYPQPENNALNQSDTSSNVIKDASNDSSKISKPAAKDSKNTDLKTTDSKISESKTIESRSSGAKIILEPPPYDEILSDVDE